MSEPTEAQLRGMTRAIRDSVLSRIEKKLTAKLEADVAVRLAEMVAGAVERKFQDVLADLAGFRDELAVMRDTLNRPKIHVDVKSVPPKVDLHLPDSRRRKKISKLLRDPHTGEVVGMTSEWLDDAGLPVSPRGENDE